MRCTALRHHMPLLAIFGEIGCDIRLANHPGGARIGRASDWTCRSCFTCQTIQAPVCSEDARAPRHRFGLPPPPPEVCRCSIFNPRILPVGFRSLLRPSTSLKEAPRKTLRNATFSAGWRVRVVKVPSHAHASFDAIRLDLCISASPFESALASHRHRQPHPLDDFIVAIKHANRAPPRTGSSISVPRRTSHRLKRARVVLTNRRLGAWRNHALDRTNSCPCPEPDLRGAPA